MTRTSTPTQSWPRAIVFDLDGTLVDSAPDIQLAINAAFAPLGVAPFDLDAVKGLIGGGAPAAINRAAKLLGLPLSPEQEAAALARFYPVYATASREGRGLYPGARELLEAWTAADIPLALCTNKSQPITDIAVKALGIDTYFRAIVGARDDLPKKPDPAPLRIALAALGAPPETAVMIGDTAADIGAARAAGVTAVALSHGYSKFPATELGADAVAANLHELPSIIAALAQSRS